MAKGFERREYQKSRGMEYAGHPDASTIRKLGEIVSDLYLNTDEGERPRMWASAARLLAKTKADKERVAKIMLEKRVGALSKLVTDLEHEMNAPKVGRAAASAEPVVGSSNPSLDPQSQGGQTSTQTGEPQVSTEASESNSESGGSASATQSPDSNQLKQALKAFKKRLKLTRLDEESRLGVRAMSSGRKSAIVAIMPPREYPQSVWEELARQGRLRNAGSGFYELVEGNP